MNALIFVTTPPSRKATTTNTQIPVAQEKADAANDTAAADADDLNVSMNRGERLKAIEQRIAKLKSDADTKAAAALSAASEAQDVRDSLDALRVQGENRRAEMGIGTPSYLHNGGEWYLTAPAYGLRVDHNPQSRSGDLFPPRPRRCRWLMWSCRRCRSNVWRRYVPDFGNELGEVRF